MNRQKKINGIFKKKLKKFKSKMHTSNKPAYVSKAEREKIENEKQNTQNCE
ncbi:DUF2986 domain-containing protein [Pseudoalteromonas denitrificans]|jgi:hypothetical protein|uniref:DUF2986 domain-containing protein n=1 Tax=Pseudoalteromonas denitrificans DSM 6059 TaxID=1123010 RepID=A0A1I1NTX7_9GAMM|nr:DUF2986 domain-containing protein [Pseudoalteromonas denitrificans]SFD00876.1 Protein of unknown function [Pseudoalteromonas denitrificans DSM 6059]